MFSTRVRGGKAFAAKQKVREFKKVLLKSKRIEKRLGKKIEPNDLIAKATDNLNKKRPIKYGFTPNHVEEKSLEDSSFVELYDIHRLVRVKDDEDRVVRYEERKDNRKKRKQRDPLDIGEKVLVIAERLKRKNAPGNLYKSTTENKPFFNRDRVFIINKKVLVDNEDSYYYWLKENQAKVNGRFYRQELFALRNQFI